MARPPLRLAAGPLLMALFAVVAAGLPACTYDATEVLVHVDTDAPANRPMTIQVTVRAAGSDAGATRAWVRGNAPSGIALPASFAIVPSVVGGDEVVTLIVDAHLARGTAGEPEITFQRIARFRLTPRQTTVVRIFLPVACGARSTGCLTVPDAQCTVSLRCADQTQTCGNEGACVDREVTPLPRGQDDAGTRDVMDVPSIDAPADSSDAGCPTGEMACLGTCVSPLDVRNCGVCGRVCTSPPDALPVCVAGSCDFTCAVGFHRCGDACLSNASVNSCGALCVPCEPRTGATVACDGTRCTYACTAARGDCDAVPSNGCETDLNINPGHCSMCGRVCPGGACAAGVCGTSTCPAGTGDCDGMAGNGCETDLRTSVDNCGSCGNRCSFPNAASLCTSRVCTLGPCAAGYANCDAAAPNGCEAHLATDANNCGTCGVRCTVANGVGSCAAGACTIASCNVGFHPCAGACVPNNSTAACGASCTACAAPANGMALCDGVSCGFTCISGYMPSGAMCVPAAVCGNGILEAIETCDDGNTAAGDGCGDRCRYEGDPGDNCGVATTILGTGYWRGYTTSFVNDFTLTCDSAGGPDMVYGFFPPSSGTLVVTLTPETGADFALAGGAVCNGAFIACSNSGGVNAIETLTVPGVTAGAPFFVVVKSIGFPGRNFVIRFQVM